MDEQAIKQLVSLAVEAALKEHSTVLLKDVSDYVDNRTQALEDMVTKPTETEPESPLATRLALLEQELATAKADKERQDNDNRYLKFQGSIQQALNSRTDVIHTDMLHELLTNRLAKGYSEKDGTFITKTGKTVDEEVKAFLDTEAGKHFVKPVQVAQGVSTAPGDRSQKPTRQENVNTLAQALLK